MHLSTYICTSNSHNQIWALRGKASTIFLTWLQNLYWLIFFHFNFKVPKRIWTFFLKYELRSWRPYLRYVRETNRRFCMFTNPKTVFIYKIFCALYSTLDPWNIAVRGCWRGMFILWNFTRNLAVNLDFKVLILPCFSLMLNADEVALHMNQLIAVLCGTGERIKFVFYTFQSLVEPLVNEKWIAFARNNNFWNNK